MDTIRTVETPEGVTLELRLAGPVPRAGAWVIDFMARMVAYWAVAMVTAAMGEAGQGVLLIVIFLGEWFYPVLFEVYRGGATPGKRTMGLVVVHDDGTPVSASASVLRNLLRVADALPFGYLAGLGSMVVDPQFRRLGDLAAGTVVVYRDPVRVGGRVPDVAPLPLPFPLDVDEQRAILSFAERSTGWTPERAEELASLLTPLTGTPGAESVPRLHRYAAWILGRR